MLFMAFEDVGSILFRDILKVYEYCAGCSPFTGNTLTDIVLYFFIPMVFLILVIYLMLARLFPTGYKGIKLLVGVAAFLFVIFSGLFRIFIYLGGPYFVFLVVVFGLGMFLYNHFRPPA